MTNATWEITVTYDALDDEWGWDATGVPAGSETDRTVTGSGHADTKNEAVVAARLFATEATREYYTIPTRKELPDHDAR